MVAPCIDLWMGVDISIGQIVEVRYNPTTSRNLVNQATMYQRKL